jgi:hypothetical protein
MTVTNEVGEVVKTVVWLLLRGDHQMNEIR